MGNGGADRPRELQEALRDGQLLDGIGRGERQSQKAFYQLFREQVASIIFRMVGDVDHLDDLICEAFITSFERAHTCTSEMSLSVWLYQICMDVVSKGRHRSKSTSELSVVQPGIENRPSTAAKGTSREQAYQTRARELLTKMPKARRTVFFLSEVEGLPIRQIALVVRARPFIVRGRLFLAKREFFRLAGQGFAK